MTELRWILILCGAVLLIGIYLVGRRGGKTSATTNDAVIRSRAEPALAPTTLVRSVTADPVLVDEEAPDAEPAKPAERITLSQRTPVPAPVVRTVDASRADAGRDLRRGRVEPTLGEAAMPDSPVAAAAGDEADAGDDVALTAELPAREPADAPTLTMSSTTPPSRRIERRKIVSLRLAAPGRFAGEALREALEAESLRHGRYEVFHRLNDADVSIFSIASMVEPGTFDLEDMATLTYPGVTLFAQLPGPVPGVQALHDMVVCGKRLQELLGGTLQDDRGVPLTVHRIDRLRQEIVDFERSQPREPGSRAPAP